MEDSKDAHALDLNGLGQGGRQWMVGKKPKYRIHPARKLQNQTLYNLSSMASAKHAKCRNENAASISTIFPSHAYQPIEALPHHLMSQNASYSTA